MHICIRRSADSVTDLFNSHGESTRGRDTQFKNSNAEIQFLYICDHLEGLIQTLGRPAKALDLQPTNPLPPLPLLASF